MDSRTKTSTIWFDVEDLLRYGATRRRPSGIQRLSFQIYQAFKDTTGASLDVGFVRHAPDSRFRVVDWAEVTGLFETLEEAAIIVGLPSELPPDSLIQPAGDQDAAAPQRRFDRLRRLSRRLPERFRTPALQLAAMQMGAFVAFGRTTAAIIGKAVGMRRRSTSMDVTLTGPALPVSELPPGILLETVARRGDILASIGSPWEDEDYAARLARARSRLGMQVAVLVYDMIPVIRPEWCHRGIIRVFKNYYSSVLPIADTVFTISRSTADDLQRWCRKTGVQLATAPVVVPVGSGFATMGGDKPERLALLGLPPRYVLFVATIEARKNHLLLFRVWRSLLDTMDHDAVPELVFVGAQGWLVRNFMQQLENSRFLNGKIRIIHNLSDDDLVAVYKGCMFTVFPSLYEGWGLPVTEAFRFGKPCIAAGVSSIPEAGGSHARYFDPGRLSDATRMIRRAIEDEEDLAAWTNQIRDEFRPIAWTEATRSMEAAFLATESSRRVAVQ